MMDLDGWMLDEWVMLDNDDGWRLMTWRDDSPMHEDAAILSSSADVLIWLFEIWTDVRRDDILYIDDLPFQWLFSSWIDADGHHIMHAIDILPLNYFWLT